MKKFDEMINRLLVNRLFWYIILGVESLLVYKYHLDDRYIDMALDKVLYFASLEVIVYSEVAVRFSKVIIRIEKYKPQLKEIAHLILKGDDKVP